jgi:hypothetical protein
MALRLTTLQRVKDYLDIEKPDNDRRIDALVLAVSADLERRMGRSLFLDAYTETFSPRGDQLRFPLKAWPVSSVSSVTEALDRDFSAATAIDPDSYLVRDGVLIFVDGYVPFPGTDTLQVVYTGGLASTTDAIVLAYPDLEFAARLQVALVLQRAKTIGVGTEAILGTSITVGEPIDLLPQVRQVVADYRRPTFGV